MSNRARGDYLERQTRDALAAYGWLLVRSGGSFGPADLVALRRGKRPLLVQCKILGRGKAFPRLDPAERRALWAASEQAGARPIIATRYTGGRVTLLEMVGPEWPRFIAVDELRVPNRPGKGPKNG